MNLLDDGSGITRDKPAAPECHRASRPRFSACQALPPDVGDFALPSAAPGQVVGRPARAAVQLPAGPAHRAIAERAERQRISDEQTSRGLGLDPDLVRSVAHRRWLPWELADEVAVALGRHPSELWPEWFQGIAGPARGNQLDRMEP